ncbi:MAG: PKD domain-containing protein [Candidatus Symbiothrix sp.]|jgi:hypothetical protein|nr:PKD domain-containing protein [Candidatus Symbiothrix sp.]
MKNLFFFITVICLLAACTPDNPQIEDLADADDLRIKIFDMEEDNAYMLINGLKGQILPPKWDFGNGETAIGDTVFAKYAFAGTYTVVMTGFDGAKNISATKNIKITQDNMAFVSDPVYHFLTGGLEMEEGKTWVLDSLRTGHVRLWKRQTGQESDNKRPPLFYGGAGMYDDEITFKLLGAECRYENHGQSFSHGGTIDGVEFFRIEQLKQMGAMSSFTAAPAAIGDYIVNYTPEQNPQKWAISKRTEKVNNEDKDVYYLKLTGGAYMFFYRGNSPSDVEYKIDSIGENYLRVIHYETSPASRATARWEDHYILVPKGYPLETEEPATPDPPKEETINENFEAPVKSLTFLYFDAAQTGWMGLPSYSVVRNVSQTGINPSDSIARFVRGTGYDELLKILRSYTFDLASKNKLKMKVYFPSTNNYQGVNLNPTVEVSLANSKNASQAIAVKSFTLTTTDFNKWMELTFDFSEFAAISDFDTWTIRFGGQYPKGTLASPGVFYFDDLNLTN